MVGRSIPLDRFGSVTPRIISASSNPLSVGHDSRALRGVLLVRIVLPTPAPD